MSDKSIDTLNGTESLDELEAMLDELEADNSDSDSNSENGTADTTQKVEEAATTAGDDEGSQSKKDEAPEKEGDKQEEPETETDSEPVRAVLSKDGKHVIPYEVLAAEREETKRLRAENQQLQEQATEREKLQQLLDKHGIDAGADELNLEEIEQLAEDYPDVGKAVAGIAKKLQAIEQQFQTPAPADNPVQQAIDSLPDLKAWQTGDQDRFTFAVTVDDQLKADPQWSDKPMAERFAEAERRTKAAFGDPVASNSTEKEPAGGKRPEKESPKSEDQIPNSPSSIGSAGRHKVDGSIEQLAAMDVSSLTAQMSGMTESQIEALLSQIDS